MKLAFILHNYQPLTQYPEVLEDITNRCYRPLLSLLLNYPKVKITFNVPASLVELWRGAGGKYDDVFSLLGKLVNREQIELLGSAAYHPLLFKLPASEILRQVKLNERIHKQYLPGFEVGGGFFPPELALDERVLEVVGSCGYRWAISEEPVIMEDSSSYIYRAEDLDLGVVLRNRSLSLDFAFGRVTSATDVLSKDLTNPVVALDGETFGWHHKDGLELLRALFEEDALSFPLVSDLVERELPSAPEISVVKSSWGQRGSGSGIYYPRWENPQNEVHQLQWELTYLAISAVNNSKYKLVSTKFQAPSSKKSQIPSSKEFGAYDFEFGISDRGEEDLSGKQREWLEARYLLDKALHSDQYFWADADNVWHLGMVERGARMLRDVVLDLPDKDKSLGKQAEDLYDKIITTGKKLYGEEVKS